MTKTSGIEIDSNFGIWSFEFVSDLGLRRAPRPELGSKAQTSARSSAEAHSSSSIESPSRFRYSALVAAEGGPTPAVLHGGKNAILSRKL